MTYLELAKLGKNDWWRYLLGIVIIGVMWQVVGGIPMFLLVMWMMTDNDPSTNFIQQTMRFEGIDPLISYLAISFSFVCLFAGIFLVVHFLHARYFNTLINTSTRMNWARFFQAFGVYLGLMVLLSVVGYLFDPESIEFNLNLKALIIFLPFALVLTPLQACAEELLFRGYLTQLFGLLLKNKAVVAILTSILFMTLHLWNPEVKINPWLMPLTYFTMGLSLALITIRDNGLELAMGAHSANNLYAFMIMNYEKSAVESPSVFSTAAPDPLMSLVGFIITGALFYFIVYKLFGERKDQSVELRTPEQQAALSGEPV